MKTVEMPMGRTPLILFPSISMVFPSVKTGEDDMGELSMGVTRLMLVSSIMVGYEDTVEISIGRTLFMLVSSVKFYDEDMQ